MVRTTQNTMKRLLQPLPENYSGLNADLITQYANTQSFAVEPQESGAIYILLLNGEAVYVGQSETIVGMWGRIACHFRNKQFDRVCAWLCDQTRLNEAEAILIYELQPKYNILFPPQSVVLTKAKLKEHFGCNGHQVNSFLRKHKVQLRMNACRLDRIPITKRQQE